jgi:hypothetical protein
MTKAKQTVAQNVVMTFGWQKNYNKVQGGEKVNYNRYRTNIASYSLSNNRQSKIN